MKKSSVFARLALTGLVLLIAGCSSAPVHYHTLVPASDVPESQADRTGKTVRISTLSLPAPVDRSQIVVRRSDSSLAILESDWWSATLVDEMRSALSAELARESVPETGDQTPVVHLNVDVRRFDSVPDRYALIDAQWTLAVNREVKRSEMTCSAVFRSGADDGLEALILAQQKNIRQFAGAINRSVASLLAGKSNCE